MGFKLKDYIFQKLDQRYIYSKYMNISIEDINYCISTGDKISNPLRVDKDPSLSFKWYGDKLIATDFGNRDYRGDIFKIVGIVINKNCNNSEHFIEICCDIIDTCLSNKTIKRNIKNEDISKNEKREVELEFIEKSFNKSDYNYFSKFGISEEYVDKYIRCADRYIINGFMAKYRYRTNDPCYVYDVNPDKLKFYFPFRSKKDVRFITNNKCPIECINEISNKDYTLLIKGFKDKILLKRLFDFYNINDFNIFSLSSESVLLTDDIYKLLKHKTSSGRIFSIMDLDNAGISCMDDLNKKYNIEPIYFSKGFNAKDPTDLVLLKGYSFVKSHFKIILNELNL